MILFVLALALAEIPNSCYVSRGLPQNFDISFDFCLFYEENSCCAVGHTTEIFGAIQTAVDVGEECRDLKRFNLDTKIPIIHQWYCLPCNPFQPKFTNETTREIYICQDFADQLWSNFTDTTNDLYKCGLRIDEGVVVPSFRFSNSSDFMNTAKPLYLSDFSFVVRSDLEECTEDSQGPCCFTASSTRILPMIFALFF